MVKPTTTAHFIITFGVWYLRYLRFQLQQLMMLSGGSCVILDVDGPCCSQANLVMYIREVGIVYPKLE